MKIDVLQAIAGPTRQEISGIMVENYMNIHAVANHFNISIPAIILSEYCLILNREEGLDRVMRLSFAKLERVVNGRGM